MTVEERLNEIENENNIHYSDYNTTFLLALVKKYREAFQQMSIRYPGEECMEILEDAWEYNPEESE